MALHTRRTDRSLPTGLFVFKRVPHLSHLTQFPRALSPEGNGMIRRRQASGGGTAACRKKAPKRDKLTWGLVPLQMNYRFSYEPPSFS